VGFLLEFTNHLLSSAGARRNPGRAQGLSEEAGEAFHAIGFGSSVIFVDLVNT
jgi:hypothetical protein